ncbi:MAG: hypothetical protein ACI9OO_000599 [Bacteroidia bacterium]|jgi:hypothetical protein
MNVGAAVSLQCFLDAVVAPTLGCGAASVYRLDGRLFCDHGFQLYREYRDAYGQSLRCVAVAKAAGDSVCVGCRAQGDYDA